MTDTPRGGRSARPLVSVVIPFRDPGAFFREAIDSVVAQTYDQWELILVDDASSDGSTEVARSYAERDPARIRVVRQPSNVGASAARNAGVRIARGALIAFLDGDDVWLPHKLDAQVALLAQYPRVGMLYGETEYWYSWTGRDEDRARDMFPWLGVNGTSVIDPPALLTKCLAGDAAVPCTCSIILRREAIERAGGFEDQFTGMFDDQAFYAKVMLAERVLVATERWDRYRRHPSSLYSSAKRAGTVRADRLAYLAWLHDYVESSRLTSDAPRDAVRRAAWITRYPRLARLAFLSRWIDPIRRVGSQNPALRSE
ncbi:MAG TPA: glycosyltransferase [Gemmatimonadaceae bacterium]|nr:glycosyltransferase [Gemmatimonadaceae bacterium]